MYVEVDGVGWWVPCPASSGTQTTGPGDVEVTLSSWRTVGGGSGHASTQGVTQGRQEFIVSSLSRSEDGFRGVGDPPSGVRTDWGSGFGSRG